MNNTGGPAFPGLHPSKECHYQDSGMTLRDYFAAKALEYYGVTTKPYYGFTTKPYDTTDEAAKSCYAMADAMLKARGA